MVLRKGLYPLVVCLLLVMAWCPAAAPNGALPNGFVYVDEIIPDVKVNLRYFSNHNFVGERIDGYLAPRCILTGEAAEALKGVQED